MTEGLIWGGYDGKTVNHTLGEHSELALDFNHTSQTVYKFKLLGLIFSDNCRGLKFEKQKS